MGMICSYEPEQEATEIIIERKRQKATDQQEVADKQLDSGRCKTFLVEFDTLATINPSLAKNMFFQSLARGYLARLSVKADLHQLDFQSHLQSLAKTYLVQKDFASKFNDNLFGKYKILSGTINDKTAEIILNLEKTLPDIAPTEGLINSETLVKISKGVYYQGEWKNQKRSGLGFLVEKDGSKYIGNFKDGLKDGKGRLIWPNGDYYEGGFKNNEIHGKGKIFATDGSVVSGKFKMGDLDGDGMQSWKNGSNYTGSFKKLQKNGYGELVLPNHSQYKGHFKNGAFHGRGILKYDDGKVYDGEWKNGKMNGFGKFKWPNGKFYEGQYVNDKKNGVGKMVYPDKKIYNGEWEDDFQNGKAIYTFYDMKKKRMRSMNSIWQHGARLEWLTKDGKILLT